jgi:2-hydroxy-3-keto-5-methylthiopentenyl-1-phosphate phosphatase
MSLLSVTVADASFLSDLKSSLVSEYNKFVHDHPRVGEAVSEVSVNTSCLVLMNRSIDRSMRCSLSSQTLTRYENFAKNVKEIHDLKQQLNNVTTSMTD